MRNKNFRVDIEGFIVNQLDHDVYDIAIPRQTIEFEEEYSYSTILRIKNPNYPKIKEILLRIADQNYAALGDNITFSAFISIWVESDSEFAEEDEYEIVCKYITKFEPVIRSGIDGIDVANSDLWPKLR